MSSSSSANPLTAYLAGELTAEQLVAAVTAEYYQGTGNGKRETLRPIIDVVERAHPGVVELTASDQHPGFDVRMAERRFPKRYEGDLREAVQNVVGAQHAAPLHHSPITVVSTSGILSRVIRALRRLFTAST